MVAEYACIQKLKGTDLGPQGLEQVKAEGTPAIQVKWRGGAGWIERGGSLAGWVVLTPPWTASLSPGGHPILQGQQAQKEGPRTCH